MAPLSKRDLVLVLTAAIAARVLVWQLLPLDWNWDSYHHWQISWLSLKIGLPQGRLWDLNGCEYYWGMLPHLVDGLLMAVAGSPSLQPIRLLNSALGAVNAGIVYLIGARFGSQRVGLWAGLLFAVFPVAAVFDVLALQDTMALTLLLAS
ncbi:MAG: glycosyltransferase family 39 protein, partial [Candidatus Bathyarchaeota archaeon]|nr:glycosyltransferase family 39 protein [Candidatus Bathyarchaeota archaeon]